MPDFPFKTTPYDHQRKCWELSRDRPEYGLFLEMGCGKTKIILDTTGYLYLDKKIQGNVVVAPKGVYRNWVDNEIPTHMTDAIKHKVAHWSSHDTKEIRDGIRTINAEGDFLRTLVVNVEAMNSERVEDMVAQFLKKYPSLLTVDESTTIKNPKAGRTNVLTALGRLAKYRRICTGNPIPNGPLDLYSQSEFLKKGISGFQNYFAFRNRFAVLQEMKLGPRSFKKVVGYKDLDAIKILMSRFAFVIKKKDCLDLPPKVYQVVDVDMGPQQKEAYNKMLEESFIKLDTGQVSAQMVMTQLLRLHQISCGFMKPDFGDEIPFDEPNDRLETMMEVLEQAPGKAIIWATYRYNVKQIIKKISEKYGREAIVDFYGETTDDERTYAKKAFQDPTSPVRFIVSNPDSGKFGNTWTQATTVIYFSNSYNLEARDQSEDRAHRIGQQGAVHSPGEDPSVLYVDLRVRGTVDDKILKVLKNKRKLTDEIVQSNWKWLLGEAA